MDGVPYTKTGQVEDHIGPGQDPPESRLIPDVGHRQATTIPVKIRQVFTPSVDQVVNHDHGGPTITKLVGQLGTDKTGPAGDYHTGVGKIVIHYRSLTKET
jgi:hypothetical protein